MDALYPSVRHSSRNLKYIVACADVVIDTTSTSTVITTVGNNGRPHSHVSIYTNNHLHNYEGNIRQYRFVPGDGWSAVYCTFQKSFDHP